MVLIAYVFLKIQTAKDLIKEICKNPYFRTPLDSQHINTSQRLVKCA